jgi:hypothetical protein
MTVPPLPRDWASRPLLGKEDGSIPNAGEVKSISADIMVKARVKVFMFLLIYGEGTGVKGAVLNILYPVHSTQEPVVRKLRQLQFKTEMRTIGIC